MEAVYALMPAFKRQFFTLYLSSFNGHGSMLFSCIPFMKKTFGIILIVLLAIGYAYMSSIRPISIQDMAADDRKTMQPALDSTMQRLGARNRFMDSLKWLIKSKQLAGASTIIDRLINNDPKDESYYNLKGEVYEAKNEDDSAMLEYRYAKTLAPGWPDAYNRQAGIFIKRKQYDSAIINYRHLTCDFDYYPDWNLKLASAFELLNKNDSAVKYYNKYLSFNTADSNEVKQKIQQLKSGPSLHIKP